MTTTAKGRKQKNTRTSGKRNPFPVQLLWIGSVRHD